MSASQNAKCDNLYWFAHYNMECPSARYRGVYPLQLLQTDFGINSIIVFPDRSARGILRFMSTYVACLLWPKPNSTLVIQKVCSNGIYATALKLLVKLTRLKTIYDIDDAEYLRKPSETLNLFLKNCDSVTVGSATLKTYCSKFNNHVVLNTSPVISHSSRKSNLKSTPLKIGWVGDFGNGNRIGKRFSHKTSLYKLLFPVLRQVDFPVELILIGIKEPRDVPEIQAYFSNSEYVNVTIPEKLNWKNDQWLYSMLSQLDVGIALMLDHPFNQSKSAFKAKQYLSCGVPVIASDVGENVNFVTDTKTGFICKDDITVLDALVKIREMEPNSYGSMIEESCKSQNLFSIKNYCQNLIEILD